MNWRTSPPAVVRAGVAPRGFLPPVLVEVDAPAAVLAPPVEPPQVQVGRPEVVVDHVQDDREPVPVGLPDELLERLRPAVGALDREDVGRVVPPRPVPGELGHRHHLEAVHPQGLEVVEPADDVLERPRPIVARVGVVERPDVQLVDHPLVPRRGLEVGLAPVERRVVDDPVADRAGDLLRVGVDPGELARRRLEVEPVLVAGLRPRHVGVPVAFGVLTGERVLAGLPVVERADHRHRVGVRGPDPEGDALRVEDGPHPGVGRRPVGPPPDRDGGQRVRHRPGRAAEGGLGDRHGAAPW